MINMPKFNSIFKEELYDYINYKKSLGYNYTNRSSYSNIETLDKFFIELKLNEKKIDNDMFEMWLLKCSSFSGRTKQSYYNAIHSFGTYLINLGYTNIFIDLFPNCPYKRDKFIPYIFNSEEINKIFENSKNNEILHLMLYFLYNCGLRIGEVVNLKVKNLNSLDQSILIENSKNNKSRLIPLTSSIFKLVNNYIVRNNLLDNDYIFKNNCKRRTVIETTRKQFYEILNKSGISKRENNKHQRLHDLRHTFAVHALEQMLKHNLDLYISLPMLSVYMGHESIVETEYYLRLVPEYEDKVLTSKNYLKNLYIEKELYHE